MSVDPLPPDVPPVEAEPVPTLPVLAAEEAAPQVTTPPARPIPGFWGAIALTAAAVGLQSVGGLIYLYVFAGDWRKLGVEEITRRLAVPSTVLMLLSALILVLVVHGGNARRVLAVRRVGIAQLLIAALLVPPCLILSLSLADWTSARLRHDEPAADAETGSLAPRSRRATGALSEIAEATYGQLADRSWPVILLGFCLLPAVGEEVFFRGLLGRGLVGRYGAAGVLCASFLFAVHHLTPDHIAATVLLGFVAQLIYLSAKSLWAPITLHALNNVTALLSDKWEAEFGRDPTGLAKFAGATPVPLVAASAVAVVLLVALLHAMRTRWIKPDGTAWDPGYRTAEMPPAELGATAVNERPAAGIMFWALLGYVAFALAYLWYAFVGPAAG
ncbi:MAG: lysostaphin resistance A-like protein [Planctomycetaceae bacterium]